MGCNPFISVKGQMHSVPGRLKTLKFHLWKMDRCDFDHEERVNVTELSKYAVFYLTALPLRDIANKQQQAARGTRQTIIQGYNRPLEFYSPIYKDTDAFPPVQPDQRRTLYWNPSVRTDSEGKATIECYNSNYSAPLIISAETISNGVTGTLTYSTLEHQ